MHSNTFAADPAVHVDIIRQALWRPSRRAAVMVGAGFSRNAIVAGKSFPMWHDFRERFRSILGDNTLEHSPPQLAEMVEALAGRSKVDEVLLEAIPDTTSQPGRLHHKLLRLPWADIFTTNYDTLLERARVGVTEQRYSTVMSPADIPLMERPRIVKLNGSFPSNRPFIFTTEDFRTYETKFAPFVNMIRQSIMENVFCMIGFSGDDPNFVQWLGWVRDQLGPSAPKVYLCGVLDLNRSKQVYYQSARVVPVDLGPLFPQASGPAGERHARALEWLLNSLENGRPMSSAEWPSGGPPPNLSSAELQGPAPLPREETTSPPPSVMAPTQIGTQAACEELLSQLDALRKSRPGWVLLPEPNRKAIFARLHDWLYDSHATEKAAAVMATMPERTQLRLLAGFAFWIRDILLRAPKWYVEWSSVLVRRINPRPALIQIPASTKLDGADDEDLAAYVEVVFAMIRNAWQTEDDEELEFFLSAIQRVVQTSPPLLARWHHHRAIARLFALNFAGLRAAAAEWPEQKELPFWEGHRARAILDAGLAIEPLDIVETALESVRLATRAEKLDLEALSTEGWLVSLLRELRRRRLFSKETDAGVPSSLQIMKKASDRLEELEAIACNPLEDLRKRITAAEDAQPADVRTTRKTEFDPGVSSLNVSFSNASGAEWVFLNTLVDGPTVFTGTPKSFLSTGIRLWNQAPRLALSLAVLAGGDLLSELLAREELLRMNRENSARLFTWLLSATTALLDEITPYKEGGLQRMLEALSRLTLGRTTNELSELLKLGIRVYQTASLEDDGKSVLAAVFRRVFFAASKEAKLRWLPELVGMRFATQGNWRDEPLLYFHDGDFAANQSLFNPQIDARLDTTVLALESESELVRIRAAVRLDSLMRIGLLTGERERNAWSRLWKHVNDGLPECWPFRKFLLLDWPSSDSSTVEAIKKALLNLGTYEPSVFFIDLIRGSKTVRTPSGQKRIEWSVPEATNLFHLTLKLLKQGYVRSIAPLGTKEKARLSFAASAAISLALVPKMDIDSVKEDLARFRDELFEHGVGQSAVDVALSLRADVKASVPKSVIDGFDSSLEYFVASSVLATRMLAAAYPGSDQASAQAIDAWIAFLRARRTSGLTGALEGMAQLLREAPSTLSGQQLDELCSVAELLFLDFTGPIAADTIADAADRLEVRGAASRFASDLANALKKRSLVVPRGLERWRQFAAESPLPEMWRPWEQ